MAASKAKKTELIRNGVRDASLVRWMENPMGELGRRKGIPGTGWSHP